MSQRVRILLAVAVVVLPLVVLDAIRLAQKYGEEQDSARAERLRMVESAALALRVFMENNAAALRAVALYPELARGRASNELRDYLHRVVQDKPDWVGLGIIGPDGVTLLGTSGSAGVYLGDRPYFQQAVSSGQAVVSSGIVGRVTGRTNVVIATPFARERGGRGVLVAPLPIEAFADQLLPLVRVRGAQLSVVDGEGQLIAHSDGGRRRGLVSVREAPGVAAALRGETGTLLVDDQLVAYAAVRPYGWAVVAHEPTASALAAARRELVEELATLVAMLAVVSLLSWYLSGRLSRAYEREVAARAEVERALRTRDDFLAAASHDLRTPLSAVRSASDLLKVSMRRTGTVAAERLESCAAHIDSATRRMAAQIDALLDVARLETGAPLDLALAEVDLPPMLREIAEEAKLLNPRHRIALEGPGQLVLRADAQRLRRAIANLVGNAAKYSPGGGDIALRLERQPGSAWAVLEVSDKGLGIPPDEIGSVFERFRRGSNVVGRIPGTGIGLAGAKQIVEQLGGSIEISSRLGEGTTVTVRLPCGADALATASPRKEAA